MFSRMMFAGGFSGFASPLGFNGNTYSETGVGSVSASLVIRNNGRWGVEGSVSGTIASGDWALGAPQGGLGDTIHVRFTRTGSSGGACGSSTGTTSWLALTTDRQVTVTAVAGGSPCSQSANYTVEFSQDGGTTIGASGTIQINVLANPV